MAKSILDQDGYAYKYIDLENVYSDWKEVFVELKPYIGNQRSIPIVFKTSLEGLESFKSLESLKSLEGLDFSIFTFIGTYFDLEEELEASRLGSLEIDDNY